MALIPEPAAPSEIDVTYDPRPWSALTKWALTLIGVAHFIALSLVAIQAVSLIDHDGIAYIRIATYYLHRQWHLAVSGYWGPLFSWFMIPLQLATGDPQIAARVAMMLSAMLFYAAALVFFRTIRLPQLAVVLGALGMAVMSISSSANNETPDLLLSALSIVTLSILITDRWADRRPLQVLAGVLWGLCYLTKAIALPWGIASTIAIGFLWWLAGLRRPRAIAAAVAVTIAAQLVVAAPWIAVLSHRYGHFVFSTTARIAHATVGPWELNRNNPYQHDIHRFHQVLLRIEKPEPGRITSWEDPPETQYTDWSPFANRTFFRHQLDIIWMNALISVRYLTRFDTISLSTAGFIAVFCLVPFKRETLARQRWRWVAVPMLILVLAYLPVYSGSFRYFLPLAIPMVTFGYYAVLIASQRAFGNRPLALTALTVVALMSTIAGWVPAAEYAVGAPITLVQRSSMWALPLAHRLETIGVAGPVVGGASITGAHLGLFTAFAMNQPWYGEVLRPTPEVYRDSGADLIFVVRYTSIARRIQGQPWAEDLDPMLFTADETRKCPVKVFRIRKEMLTSPRGTPARY
jgi:hypothetical protein